MEDKGISQFETNCCQKLQLDIQCIWIPFKGLKLALNMERNMQSEPRDLLSAEEIAENMFGKIKGLLDLLLLNEGISPKV